MPKPDEFSPLRMYGRKSVFVKRISEGYTEVAFGGGNWVGDSRIVRLWAFYHPDGKIATYEHPKGMTPDMHTIRGEPFEAEYTNEEFQRHLQEFQIKLDTKSELVELVQDWEE